ncbi:hypothetical protein XFF7766_30080 [Xanthomonas citri pv. fuscans]|nr:hypothetical protein XFF7766_30080 [Xanthomonas citri pv. fuscans]
MREKGQRHHRRSSPSPHGRGVGVRVRAKPLIRPITRGCARALIRPYGAPSPALREKGQRRRRRSSPSPRGRGVGVRVRGEATCHVDHRRTAVANLLLSIEL